MTHLSEETLNEYLDNALTPSAQAAADAHLADCAACMDELEALRSLFTEIESLPEAPIEHDLSSAVVARLGNRAGVPPVIRWALVVQGLAVVVVLGLAWPLFPSATPSWVAALKLPAIALDLPSMGQLTELWAAQQNAWAHAFSQMSNLLPSFSLHLDPPAILQAGTLVSACLLWLVGNSLLLLLPRRASLKRRNT
jgi:anti-sigma factor RsiW